MWLLGVEDRQSTFISCAFSLLYKKINHWACSSDFTLKVVVSTINCTILFQLLIDIVTFDAFSTWAAGILTPCLHFCSLLDYHTLCS